jgi:imidazolonepropionase-like amidohydrolase
MSAVTRTLAAAASLGLFASVAGAQIAVRGETVYTMAGAPLRDGVVLVGKDGKIEKVGSAAQVAIPAGYRTLTAKVVTPGLVDAHTVVGLAGYLNQPHDQEQVETSAPIQPELRAVDAYDPEERLVSYVRGYGITTLHTGHGPQALVSGQTMIVKTAGRDVDAATLVPAAMIAVTVGEEAKGEEGKSPGSRPKMIAMLRAELVKAQEYARKRASAEKGKEPERSLKTEAFVRVLEGELPLLVTVHRAGDILTVLRLAEEFKIKLVLDGVAEAPLVVDRLQKAGFPVIVHPTMARSFGETENLSMETASVLKKAGLTVALQSGYEGYVPKTRVLLFEAAVAAANGLGLEGALASVTIDAARVLGIDKRVGSLTPGKDGDLALYDGDPFEYTSHCIGTVIEGVPVSSAVQ